ncbi:MAG: hypothetical protein M1816_000404 [Peltula sp. TS41687]|nr:MAG: hypothetical protein M1816_000404 [Peltula sp. TS41687]
MTPEPVISPSAQEEDDWTPNSWRSRSMSQEIIYPDNTVLEQVSRQLRSLPDLVSPERIESARKQLSEAARGKSFVIQGGDCAESFDDVRHDIIGAKRSLLARQSQILSSALDLPIIEIGRIAGQYAKPRSVSMETLTDQTTVFAFRGHNVNSRDPRKRLPDPRRLLIGYHLAAATLEHLNILEPTLVSTSSTTGIIPSRKLYSSHEAFHLPLESALTRGRYNTSAEFLWIGERTRSIDGAHVEYLRGLRNPIGVKIGPSMDPDTLIALLDVLNPSRNDTTTTTLITRLGACNVDIALPKLISAVQASGHNPLWMCDPCHGNTITTSRGVKTRILETILADITQTWIIHQRCNSHLGGLHLEQTGEDVTECSKPPVTLSTQPSDAKPVTAQRHSHPTKSNSGYYGAAPMDIGRDRGPLTNEEKACFAEKDYAENLDTSPA